MTSAASENPAVIIDSELDLLFKQSNASTLKEVKYEDVISQLNNPVKSKEVAGTDSGVAGTSEDGKEVAEDGITRKQRKELLSDSQEKQSRTLFLGNLPVACATDKNLIKSLKARFTPYGPVESIRFRSIPFAEPQARRVAFIKKNFRKDGTGGTCNGYVVMKTREAALAAIKENATIFAERHLRVDMAAEGEEGSSKTNTKKSIFVGNLPMDLEEEPVWQLFGKCGSVTNVRLIRDRVTNMGKGIGYVTFASKDSVDLALKLAGTQLGGRPVRVSPCSKIGMVEKKKARANSLAEKRQKQAAALVKSNPTVASSKLGAAKTEAPKITDSETAPKKVSKKEVKLQAELQTKFGQLFHKKFPFAQAISEVEKKPEKQSKMADMKVVKKKSKDSEKSMKSETKASKSEIKSETKAIKYRKSENPSKPTSKFETPSKPVSKSEIPSKPFSKPVKPTASKTSKVSVSKSAVSKPSISKPATSKPTRIVLPTERKK